MIKTKYILILLTFCATIAQGLWINWLDDEGILVVDIPLILLYIFGHKKLKLAPKTLFALVPVIVFMLWVHIGIFFAPNKLYFRQETVENIRATLIFIALISFINTKEDLQYVFLGFAIGATFQGLIAWHQWLRGPVGLGFLGEQPGLGWQAQGTFVHASVFGMYISLLSIFNYRMAVFLRPKYHKLYVAAFFIGVVALYASYNRATWIAFATSMTLMFFVDVFRGNAFKKRSAKLIFVIALIAAAGAARYGADIVNRFNDAEDSLEANRSSSRKSLALDALRIIHNHPLVGVGLNNYREYVNPETAGTKLVHCSYLLVAAETGWFGLALFLSILFSFIFIGVRTMKSKDALLSNVAAALVTAMISFSIAILPSPDYRISYVKNHIWMIFALTLVVAKLDYHLSTRKKVKKVAKSSAPKNGSIGLSGKRDVESFKPHVPPIPNIGPRHLYE